MACSARLAVLLRGWSFTALLIIIVMLQGCGPARQATLRIEVQPTDATVEVQQLPGRTRVPVQATAGGWLAPVAFTSAGTQYRVIASRSGYTAESVDVDAARFASLPEVGDNDDLRRLLINLTPQRMVRFEVSAPGATLSLLAPSGERVVLRSGEPVGFPAVLPLQPYELSVQAPGYETKVVQLPPKQIADAINRQGGVIRISLASGQFTSTRQVLAVFDPGRGLVARERHLRAWFDDPAARERTVTVAMLEGDLAVRGVTITPRGRHMIYAMIDGASGLSDGEPIRGAKLHQVPLVRGGENLRLPSSGFIDIDPFAASNRAQTLLFASNGQTRLSTFDVLAATSAAPTQIRPELQGTASHALLQPSMSAGGEVAVTRLPTEPGGQPSVVVTGGDANRRDAAAERLVIPNAVEGRISPDGRRVAYRSASEGDIFVRVITGRDAQRVTSRGGAVAGALRQIIPAADERVRQPYADICWSPDGRYLAYSSAEGRDSSGVPNYDIWIAPAHGGEPVQLTSDGSADLMPIWSSDNYIYFVSNRGGRWALHRVNSPVPLQSGF